MKKYFLSLIVLLFLLLFNVHGQNNKGIFKNAIHLELGGPGILYSINYERIIINSNSFSTSAQFGLSYFPLFTYDLLFPLVINEQFSFFNHHIELGIGFVPVRELFIDRYNDYAISKIWTNMFTGRVGYRYQKPDGRFIWRVGFTPLLRRERPGGHYYPNAPFKIFEYWGGVSIGYCW